MMDRLETFDTSDLMEFISPPKIKVLGVGGAGNNILKRLYNRKITGVETIALNTDAIHLNNCRAHTRKVLGATITQGRGTGGDPHLGKRCAEGDEETLKNALSDRGVTLEKSTITNKKGATSDRGFKLNVGGEKKYFMIMFYY